MVSLSNHEPARDLRLPVALAIVAAAIHIILNPGYGFFRDELYFIICGRHPAFGYVDQPPLIPLLAALSQAFGPSLIALRAISAIFAGASVFVTCLIADELGGALFARIFAAVVVFFTPILAAFSTQVSTDTPGMFLWPLVVLLLIRLVKGGDSRNWIGIGVALGLAANAKYSVFFFAAALFAGLLLSPQRGIMRTAWFAGGAAAAALLIAPNVIWQAVHGFPMIELLRNGQMGKNVLLSPAQYVGQQIFLLNPLLALVTAAGCIWLLLRAQWRWLGYAYLLLIAAMIVTHGKDYYPADIYPYLIAAGAVAIERLSARIPFARPVFALAVAAAGALLLPFVMPLLPERTFVAYQARVLGALHAKPIASEHHRPAALGQDFADMHGWPQLAQTVARVHASLPPARRWGVTIVASNYGEAAAIDFFGKAYGLPPALSGHNQYFLWGTRGYTGDVLIDVNGDCGASMHLFRHAFRAATFSAPYVMPYEDRMPVMLCSGIKEPLAALWPHLKDYN